METDVAALQASVAWAGFALAFVLGALMNRTRFCTMGALADAVGFGDWTRMRMWLCAIGVAIAGTQALAWAGLIDPAKTIYAGPRLAWLSHLAGGLVFGFGMVLASGCGSKTLVRIGAGSLKSLVVFVVLAVSAYMTLRGLTAVFRAGVLDPVAVDLPAGQDLPRLLAGGDPAVTATLRLLLGGVLGLALVGFALAGRDFRRPAPLLAGFGVGLAIVAAWALSGHLGYVAEDPNTLEERFVATNSGRMEAISFVGPLAYTLELLLLWSDKARIVTLGVATTLGVIAGSFAWSLLTRSFRWEGFHGTEDTANHLAGAAMMGVGGVTALGCTFGQGLSGVSTLSLGSFIALAGILAGGVAGLKYQAWRVERAMEFDAKGGQG